MVEPTPPAELLGHAAFVRSLAFGLLRDDAEAYDAAQEALVLAIEHAPAARTGGPRAWLATVLRNLVSTRRRGARRRDVRERAAARSEATGSVDDVVARAEILRVVGDAVRSLDPAAQQVVLLRHYEGLPPREVAARLGVPVETARSRLRRAYERLRERLDEGRGGNVEGWRSSLAVLVGLGAFAPEAVAAPAGALLTDGSGGAVMGSSSKIGLGVAAAAALAGAVFFLATRDGDDAGGAAEPPEPAAARALPENPTAPPTLASVPRGEPPPVPAPVPEGGRPVPPPPAPPAAPEEGPTLRVRLAASGLVTFAAEGDPWQEVGRLDAVEATAQAETLGRLVERLRAATADPRHREADGTSTSRAVLEADPEVRWTYLQWVVQALAEPAVRIARIRYVAPDGRDAVDLDLPRDRPVELPRTEPVDVPGPRASKVRVALFRRDEDDAAKATTRIRVADWEVLLPGAALPAAREAALSSFREHLAELRRSGAGDPARLGVPAPKGLRVPYADVHAVLWVLRSAGMTDVRLEGAAGPLPPRAAPK
jgi:RNA polymerase sigma-70 factor (ECF subfamily)